VVIPPLDVVLWSMVLLHKEKKITSECLLNKNIKKNKLFIQFIYIYLEDNFSY
jgi:hypothetical protein